MVELIVAAVILIVIMLIFVFFLFKNILKRMNDNAKRYFVNKMHDYDYIIEEKKSELNSIKEEIEKVEEVNRNIVKKEDDKPHIVMKQTPKEDEFIEVQFELKTPKFREEDFFKNYKELKRIFTVDNEDLIKKFVKENKSEKEEKEYNTLKKIRAKFDEESIYQCLTLEKKDQMEIIEEILTATDKKNIKWDKIKKEYKEIGMNDLIKIIEKRMEEVEPYIYIYMNVVDHNYGKLDKNIILKQYNNMSEGIIIKYRNKIYDYSI